MSMGAWSVRYEAYARAHSREPAEMLEHDAEAWPGGRMCGFILWVAGRWAAFAELRGMGAERRRGRFPFGKDGHQAFDAWLSGGRP